MAHDASALLQPYDTAFSAFVQHRTDAAFVLRHHGHINNTRSTIMGKYSLAWIMGVPAIVLVLLYLFFH